MKHDGVTTPKATHTFQIRYLQQSHNTS